MWSQDAIHLCMDARGHVKLEFRIDYSFAIANIHTACLCMCNLIILCIIIILYPSYMHKTKVA